MSDPRNNFSMEKAFYLRYFERYDLIANNVYPCWQFNEMDIIAVRKSGFVDEIEIKRSRADFLADFRKTVSIKLDEPKFCPVKNYTRHHEERGKHECLELGLNRCNYFSFYVPVELADKIMDLLPDYAGLYTFDKDMWGGYGMHEVKKPKRLHKRKISDSMRLKIAMKLHYRYWEFKQ